MENEILFFKCWRNVYIKSLIFENIKTNKTSVLNSFYSKFNYYEMTDVNLMSKNKGLEELFREKVRKGLLLNFNFSKSEIPFQSIFENFNDPNKDYEFYNQLFRNYSNYFLSSIDKTIEYATICNCKIAVEILLENYSNNSSLNLNNLLKISILNGSNNVSNYLKSNYEISLTNQEYNEIWNSLLNKTINCVPEIDSYNMNKIIKDDIISSINESIHYLVNELNAPLPAPVDESFKCFIDFSIKNKNLNFILSTCYSIAYLKSSLESFKFKDSSFIETIQILTVQELDEIKMKLTDYELNSNVQDLNENDEIISKLVGMSIIYTNINFGVNLMFYKLRYTNPTNVLEIQINETNNILNLIDLSISNGNYKQLIHFINQLQIEPTNEGKSIFLMGFESYTLFRSCKNNRNEKFNEFMQQVLEYHLDQTIPMQQKHSILDIIRFFILLNDLQLIEIVFSMLDNSNIQLPQPINQICSFISSEKMFDIIYKRFESSFLINEIISINIETIKCNPNTNLLLNHFKLNYQKNYNIQLVDYLPSPSHLSVEFIFNNFEDFKQKLKEHNVWSMRIIDTFHSPIPLNHFKKLLELIELTPTRGNNDNDNFKYHCFGSSILFEFIYSNYYQDFLNGKFDYYNGTSILNYYQSGNLKEIILNHLEKPIDFPNLMGCLDSMIKISDFDNIKFLIDYFNLSSSPTNNINNKLHINQILKSALIIISNQNKIDVISYLFENYPTLLSQDNLQILFDHCYKISGSIEILNYLIEKVRFRPSSNYQDLSSFSKSKTIITKEFFKNKI